MTVGRTIRSLRTLEDNLTQGQLAKDIDMSRQGLNLIESGKSNPGLPTLRKIAKRFDVPLAVFFTEDLDGYEAIRSALINIWFQREK